MTAVNKDKINIPKFKVGDIIRKKDDHSNCVQISKIDDNFYYAGSYIMIIDIANEEWELVEDFIMLEPHESLGISVEEYNKIENKLFWDYMHDDNEINNQKENDTIEETDIEKELFNWRHNHFSGRRDKDANGEYLERISQLDLARHFANWGKNYKSKNQ